jgi:predicted outer membrane protein
MLARGSWQRSHGVALALALIALVPVAACSVGDSAVPPVLGAEVDRVEALRASGAESGLDLARQTDGEAQINEIAAAIAEALHQGEVEMARAAAPRVTDVDVHELAQRAMREHGAARSELAVLLEEQGIPPREGAISAMLRVEATAAAVALSTMPEEELDVVYTERQVYGHAQGHALLRGLANRVERAPLRGFLDRQVVALDLQLVHAVHLLYELDDRSATP